MLSPWGPERDGWGSSHLSVFVSSSLQSYWGIRLHSLHIFKVIFATRRARKFILFWGELGFGGAALQPRSGFRGHRRSGGMAGDSRTQPPGLDNIIDGMFVMLSHYLFVTLGNKVYEENGWKYKYFTFSWKLTALSPVKIMYIGATSVSLKGWHSAVLPSAFPCYSEEMCNALPFWKALQGNNQQAPCNCNL